MAVACSFPRLIVIEGQCAGRSEGRLGCGVGVPLVAEGAGDLAAKPGVVLAEPGAFFQEAAPFGVGGFQAPKQGAAGGALAGRDGRRGGSPGGVAEPLDLLADVG